MPKESRRLARELGAVVDDDILGRIRELRAVLGLGADVPPADVSQLLAGYPCLIISPDSAASRPLAELAASSPLAADDLVRYLDEVITAGLIERSSLGMPAARRIRGRTSSARVDAILRRSHEQARAAVPAAPAQADRGAESPHVAAQVSAYLDHALDDPPRAAILEHLGTCAPCLRAYGLEAVTRELVTGGEQGWDAGRGGRIEQGWDAGRGGRIERGGADAEFRAAVMARRRLPVLAAVSPATATGAGLPGRAEPGDSGHQQAGQGASFPDPGRAPDILPASDTYCLIATVSTIADPALLGVRPVQALGRSRAAGRRPGNMPPYIQRSVDGELRDLITQSGFVLIIGDSAAGKTRTAYEAAAAVLPAHALIALKVAGTDALNAAITAAKGLRDCVLWLDDLHRLGGLGILTGSDVADLIEDDRCHRVIMATITVAEYAKFTDMNESAARQIGQHVLRKARRIFLPRMFDSSEFERAEQADDRRIKGALRHPEYGLAEYLVAGPELFYRWRAECLGGGPAARGAALISAAVDCRRAGLFGPLPAGLIERLHESYLAPRGTRNDESASLESAWHWATRPGATTAALTVQHDGDVRRVEVFSYLVDEYQRIATPADQIPQATLLAVLQHATASEAMRIAQAARDYGHYHIALQAFARAADRRARHAGDEDRRTLASRNKAARAMRLLGRYEDAEAEHRDILVIQRRVLGDSDLDTLTSLDNHARTLRLLGRYDEALAEHRTVLRARRRALGPSHPATLTTRNGIGRVLLAMNRAEEAEKEHRAVLAARIRVLSDDERHGAAEDHADVLTSRNDLGKALLALGRWAEAEAEFRVALAGRIQQHGPDHPVTASSRVDLGHTLQSLGRREEALEEFRKALLARTRVLGKDHPDTADSRRRLDAVASEIRLAQAQTGVAVARSELLAHGTGLPTALQISDLRQLGVHAARSDYPRANATESGHGAPRYVARDIDAHLRGLLGESGFILLVGDSATGKSRTAFEAAAAMLPGHILVAPRAGRDTVAAAIAVAAGLHECVLWLDDLYRLAGPEGLTRDHVTRLINDPMHHRVILATIRNADLAHFTDVNSAAHQTNSGVIRQAHHVRLEQQWTSGELRRLAAACPDLPGHVLAGQVSLPLYLVGGAELHERWQAHRLAPGAHARGAALISAAVDLRRAGLYHSPSRALIDKIHHHYLPSQDTAGQAEDLKSAWQWASRPGPAAAALTIKAPRGARRDADDAAVEVFSYLIDEFERTATIEDRVLDATLSAALAEANATEAMRIGMTARRHGRYAIGLTAFTKAADDRAGRLGTDHPDTMASRSQQARSLRLVHRFAEAEAAHRSVIADQDRVLGGNNPATLTSRDNLARVLRNTGRLHAAEEEHRAVLVARRRILGADYPDTLTSRNNLARVLHALGQLDDSEAEFRAVLAGRSNAPLLGINHPDTLSTRNDLAAVLAAAGRVADAKVEFLVVLKARLKVLGPDHPDTVITREALAALGGLAGQESQAGSLNRVGS